jgi:AcrR family transcriptional regulator
MRTTRRSDGERTHAAILDAATRVASVEGIHGLTLGRLAETLGVSKSGLYAHFGSKEQLQLETIRAAQAIVHEEVVRPALEAPEGLPRLEAICEAYFSYVERWVFPGGCFFAALNAEVDARAGAPHDVAVINARSWMALLTDICVGAQRTGELDDRVDPAQLAFELNAAFDMANYHFVLLRDPAMLERGRRATAAAIERARSAAPRRRTGSGQATHSRDRGRPS